MQEERWRESQTTITARTSELVCLPDGLNQFVVFATTGGQMSHLQEASQPASIAVVRRQPANRLDSQLKVSLAGLTGV